MRLGFYGIISICTFIAVCLIQVSPCKGSSNCKENYFTCDDGNCIPEGWKCDGEYDCDDKSDEKEELCERKKRSTTEGLLYHESYLFDCHPNFLRCPAEIQCIPMAKFCDNHRDCPIFGEDEGSQCENEERILDCNMKCGDGSRCAVTKKIDMCYCEDRFKLYNSSECVQDVNECLYEGYCDQLCTNKIPSYKCDCVPGYTMTAEGTCKAINVPSREEPTLLIADYEKVLQVNLDGQEIEPPISIAGHRIMTIDFDHRNDSACWITYHLEERKSYLQCVSLQDKNQHWQIDTEISLDTVEHFAKDWLTGNLYFTNSVLDQRFIVICNSQGKMCKAVIKFTDEIPKGLALDPTRGYLFFITWSEGQQSSIERAFMDGSNRTVIQNDESGAPYGITLDIANEHIYWTDEGSSLIKRMNYDGTNRKLVYMPQRLKDIGEDIQGFGISVFENYLYVSSQGVTVPGIMKLHRYNYTEPVHAIVKYLERPFQLQVYHRQKQPNLPKPNINPCTVDPPPCDQLCVIHFEENDDGTKHAAAQCLCGAGYMLDGGKCIKNPVCTPNCKEEDPPCDEQCQLDHSCSQDYTRCPGSECIPSKWWCDAETDCPDGTDEKFCEQRTCTVLEFRCDNGHCIQGTFQCDGNNDCGDSSDERGCPESPVHCDPETHIPCNDSGNIICLSAEYRCDKEKDCPDGSDEIGCECNNKTEFACGDRRCIPRDWRCDGDDDCGDHSDEFNCECDEKHFMCNDKNRCVPLAWKCDKDYDCEDRSDEENCPEACMPPNVTCPNEPSKCLTLSMMCNNKNDCADGWDETGLCQSNTTQCDINCTGKCKKTPNGYVCECPKGKKLAADNVTCDYINICHTWGICSQVCSVKDGKSSQHYTCSCFEGYNMTADGYTCKAVDPSEVYIIFSNRHEMRRVDLTDYKYPAPLVSGLKNTIALDFYYKDSYIFWTDVVDDKIYRGKMLSHSLTNIEPIIDVGLATTEGLAVDWIGENIYWVESNLDQIEVAKLNGSIRTTLIAGDMDSPRAIVLDPREGWMFWTDWHAPNPRIERCSMTGDESTRKQIYSINQITEGGWPNGLTIDYDFYRLYWIDARSDSIHTIKYDGSDHRTVLKDHERIGHPFAITLFGQYVYWTDWTTNELVKANKFNGSDLSVIQRTMTQPFDLQVFHPKRQPNAFNPCADNNGGCSHLCLIGRNRTIGCRCPHLSRLKEDGKTCEPENRFLLFVKSKEIRGVDLRNPNFNAIPTLTVPYVDNPAAIDYDIIGDRLYWADTGLNKINSAYVNGSGVETIIDSGISNPEGFAIDWLSRNMYFSSTSVGDSKKKASISVAKLDGAFRAEIIINNLIHPNSIAVHPTKGLMFWADIGGQDHKIYRARMDGTDSKIIVNNTKNPTSLTVDMEHHQLFFINRGNNSVMSCSLDGISCRLIKQFQNQQPLSLTLYNSNTLYVSNGEEIGKMNTTGLGYQALRKQTPQVQALLVYDENNRKKVTENGNECAKEKSYGNCAQLCLPTSRESRVCMCTAGFKRVNDTECVGITSFLMFSTEKEIRGISFNKDETEEALPLISKISMANGIDFDAKMDMIYWVDSSSHTISRIKRDLTERETIVTDEIPGIEDIAVDWVTGNVYWTDHLQDVIEVVRANKSRYVVVHGNLEKPKSVVVHPVMGYLFWTDVGKHKIEMSKLDGTERTEIITTDITEPTGLTIDYDENILYWCDKTLQKIESYNIKNGTRRVVVQSGVNECTSLTLYNEHLYWLEATSKGTIKRAHKKTGQDIVIMRSDLVDNLRDIVAFERSRQKGTNICEQKNGDCVGLCFHIGNNERNCACSYGSLAADKKSCVEHKEFLLYSRITSIESINMTRPDPNPPLPSIKNADYMKNVIGLTADFKHKRIYYSDIQRGDIQFVYFNGTKFTAIIDSVGSAEGLAFKPAFGNNTKPYLYWTSYTNSSIGRVPIHPENGTAAGKIEKVLQLGIDDHPRAIVIDSCSSQMFWTNWNDLSPKIQRAYLSGYHATSIITTEIRTPNGLAIDHLNQKLYWSDARLDKIEYADFDGRNRVVLLTDVPQHPFGLVVYGDYIYWTDWMLRAVVRINKYDNSARTYLRSQLDRQPMGIIAVAEDMDDCTVNPCYDNNFGCEEQCITKLGRGYCACGEGKILLSDGKRCGGLNVSCGIDQFVCHDQTACIEYSQTCNSIPNCLDGSDEFEEVCERAECDLGWFTCRNHRCVGHDARCNGENDCGDGSDETGCHCNKETEFQCKTGLCIQKQYRCDRDRDCPDFSDEIGCNLTCENLEIMQEIPGHFVSCNTTSQCIMVEWICDGNSDCWDNNDERNCSIDNTDHACPGSFQCNTSKSCIPLQWKCDSDDDCGDGSDEKDCPYKCEDHMFRCDDNTCLPRSWKCDGHPDCLDHSDEGKSCNNSSCKDDEFNCTNGRCIPKQWMCDGDSDCTEGEDERVENGCEPVQCDEDEFQCLNRRCIKQMYYCDRDNDCSDNSDEPPTCVYKNCSSLEFRCVNNGTCIDMDLKCNGFPDCPDHSDENDCGPHIGCKEYLCRNGICLNDSLVCNGANDCGDNSDESTKCYVNECTTGKAICSQKCIDLKIGHKCGCNEGYQLRADNYTCEDVDECKTLYPCSQFCVNTDGSFKCLCAEGYKMQSDKRSCKIADDVRPYLLLANRYYIRNVSFSGQQQLISHGLSNAVAIDFHWADQMIYWTDITSKNSSICRLNITSQNNTKEVLLNTTVKNPDGIAVDWIGKNLYWCDKTTDTIEVSKLDGKYRKVLINIGLQEPRGIEVFPSKGLFFYTDWGEPSHVSRANMDGTDNRKIISQDIAWPNALTIDYVTEKIFWADASLDYIAMANLDGTERHVILEEDLPHTFALTTFMDYIFWTDWEHLSIQKAHKFSGADRSVVAHLVHRPMDIQVFHPVRQVEIPKYKNPCHNNGGCSHLCLLRPNPYYQSIEAVCACPENFYLGTDGKTCVSNCTSSQFHCVQTSKCIPKWWYCDGRVDCEDRSDEPPTCAQYICSQPGMFRCDNGTTPEDCISPVYICDGRKQCSDGSDEKNCENFICLDGFQKCLNEHKCYSETRKCDGTLDCSGGEDELNCVNTTCKSTQFQCNNGRCVPYVWHCDEDDDCGDRSDEPAYCEWINNTCRPNYIKCAKSGRCIPESWQCDGDNDCGTHDPSDESPDVCSKQTCSATYFRCKNSHCIPGRWRCDYDNDCRDGSDEENCEYRNCSESEFRCGNHKCIPKNLKCDGEINCEDGSDETANCTSLQCSDDEFQCKKIPFCIPKDWHCDEDTDCSDGSDEWNCTHKCEAGQFQCNNSVCIPGLWMCDTDVDCNDGSDEDNVMCSKHACAPGRFRCSNNKCISMHAKCDGIDNCGDNSDEKYCEAVSCKRNEFKCNTTNQCIPTYKLCDGTNDCHDRSDESKLCTHLRRCSNRNPCEHNCQYHQAMNIYICSCKEGYKLQSDGRSCRPVNSCTMYGTCPQKCTKVQTKTKCYCDVGYESTFTEEGGHQCKAKGTKPHLLVGVENEFIRIHSPDNVGNISGDSHYSETDYKLFRIDAVDLDTQTGSASTWDAYILNHHNRTISKIPITAPKGKAESTNPKTKNKPTKLKRAASPAVNVIVSGLAEPHGIAVDWIGKHLYWTDSGTRKVEMAMLHDQKRITIAHGQLNQPFSIAVHPEAGKIYWTDRGYPAKIESANLDGSGRKELVKDDIVWPNGLTVDYANDRIYWADTKKHVIETVDLQGRDRHIVQEFNSSDPPYKLKVFEDFLYVTLYKSQSLVKIHKFRVKNTQQSTLLLKSARSIGDIVILHPSLQKSNITNYCDGANCGNAICVNLPQSRNYSCVCDDEAKFNTTTKKCEFLKNCTCKNNGTCSKIDGQPKCRCQPGYTGSKCERDMCTNFCQHGGICIKPSKPNTTPTCNCINGFYGPICENYLCNGVCENGGRCSIVNNAPACNCRPGFTGARCQSKIEESICDSFCENGGKCIVTMINHLFGGIKIPRPVCKCSSDFTGERCEQCIDLKCHNGGTCHKNATSGQFYCQCPEKFQNDPTCLWIPCINLCLNGGVCVTDVQGFHMCKCPAGYSGFRCQVESKQCSTYCKNGATCKTQTNTIEDIICLCPDGYSGKQCEIAGKCANYCQNGGKCSLDTSGNPQCTCNSKLKFDGERCEKCKCKNDGICFQKGKACNCPLLYHGELCETSICSTFCFNDGKCMNCSKNSLTNEPNCKQCICPPGYTGQRCEKATPQKQSQESSIPIVPIIVPIVAVILFIILVTIIVILIRRKRDQFKHRRMPSNGIAEVGNPIYNPHSHEEEEDGSGREMENMFHPEEDPSTHFANPMYDRYQSESTQVLLQNDEEDMPHSDGNGDIFINKKSSKRSPKKTPKKNQSNKNSFA